MSSRSKAYMRCAGACGAITRPKEKVGSVEELEADALKKGFVKIDDLLYCPRCAKKKSK